MGLESAFLEYVMCYLLLNSNAIPEISTIKSCPIIVRSSWFSTHLCKINLPSMSGDVSTLSRVNIEEIFENRYCVYARRQNSKRFVWSLVTASQFPCLLDKMADETVTRSIARLLADFEMEVKRTGSARAKNIVSLKIKCIFIPLFW